MKIKIPMINISGKKVFPIIEGGKGVRVSNGVTAGAFAKAGAVGTFSGVFAEAVDKNGESIPMYFKGKTRPERSEELTKYCIKGAISQARIAYERSEGHGRIHMNILWGIKESERLLHGVLKSTKGMIHGITCGAGMPFKLADIASKYNVYYYPIISSMRAFAALWARSYNKLPALLGGVVYEDPWKAGGHNGITNKENPENPENPYFRVSELRSYMNKVGLSTIPIIMAGGVWCLNDYEHWINNSEIGPIVFQFGTRPMLTQESPICDEWKKKLMNIKNDEVILNKFSSAGFYSSAVKNDFLNNLIERSQKQIPYKSTPDIEFKHPVNSQKLKNPLFIKTEDTIKERIWEMAGYNIKMKTPDETLIFLNQNEAKKIRKDRMECKGCLAMCKFSGWAFSKENKYSTGVIPDPRSYCIQTTLIKIIQGIDIENQMMFSGHNVFKFAHDPFYENGYIPTISELVKRILTGF